MNRIKPQLSQVNQNEVLLRANDEWLHFGNPHQVIIANTASHVVPALHEIEGLVQANHWYAAGFLSYEAASGFDMALQTQAETGFPLLWFGLYSKPRRVRLSEPEGPKKILDWQPIICQEAYSSAIAKIKDHIAEGRTYQVNYTMRLRTDCAEGAWNVFLQLAQDQNQYAAYIDTGRYAICSASPELFFQLDGDSITCRPMKGTVARGRTTGEDQKQANWLKQSEKNRAENVMIVDMIRNDLGRIARLGSVTVPRLFETERYRTLWQMTSTITAQTDASLTDIFTALFPCASITGAPKVSTMEIIAGLESTPRRIYTGTIGYIAPQRRARFNVAIRTVLVDQETQQAEYGVGGGIVWDSQSTDEYSEALLKARVLTQQKPEFSLLETLRWTPEEGFFLREKHIARMLDSADYFEIPITKETLERYLNQISSTFELPKRVRVLLARDGTLQFEAGFLSPTPDSTLLQASLAKEAVDSRNIFLFHKTTQREIYEFARRGWEELDDILLYNEMGELTEFTIGNLVVELDDRLLTPPIACGVLAGTFRAHLIETGQVAERTLSTQDLARCSKIFRINSIRGWQSVEMQ